MSNEFFFIGNLLLRKMAFEGLNIFQYLNFLSQLNFVAWR